MVLMIPTRGIIWYSLGVCLLCLIPTDTHFLFLNFLEVELKEFINRTTGGTNTPEKISMFYGLLAMTPYLSMIPGSFIASYTMDRFGRRSSSLLYPHAVAAVSSTMIGCSYYLDSYYLMLVGRITFGIGFGMTNVATSLYLSECSPPESRGTIGATLTIASGLVQVFANTFYLPWAFGKSYTWHIVCFSLIPVSVLSMVLNRYLPESPKYLHLTKRNTPRAIMVITKFYGIRTQPEEVLHGFEFEQQQTAAKVSILSIFRQFHLRQALWLSLLMGISRCLSGANLLSMFSKSMLTGMLGMTDERAKYVAIGFCVLNMIVGTIGGTQMERYGRRKIFLVCSFAMLGCSCAFTIFSSKTKDSPVFAYPSLVSLALLQAIYYFAPNAMTFFYVTEITPQAARGPIANYGVVTYYASQALYSFIYPLLQEKYGSMSIVILLIGPSLPVYVYLYLYMPETRNRPVWAVVEDWMRQKAKISLNTAPTLTEHNYLDMTNTARKRRSLEELSFLEQIAPVEVAANGEVPQAPPTSPVVSISSEIEHYSDRDTEAPDGEKETAERPKHTLVEIRSPSVVLIETLQTLNDASSADKDYLLSVAPTVQIKSSALDLAERIVAQTADPGQVSQALGGCEIPAASPLDVAKAVILSDAEPKVTISGPTEEHVATEHEAATTSITAVPEVSDDACLL